MVSIAKEIENRFETLGLYRCRYLQRSDETVDESIKYPAYTEKNGETGDVILVGRPATALDIMYEHYKYQLPLSLEIGDRIFWLHRCPARPLTAPSNSTAFHR